MTSELKTRNEKILVVEAARGFAAIYVMLGHVILLSEPSKYWPHSTYCFRLFGFGHEMVILFFLLSGFSIHYSSFHRSIWSAQGTLRYYYLRCRRIYPLFVIAILFGLCVLLLGKCLNLQPYTRIEIGLRDLLANALFLGDLYDRSGTWFAVLPVDPPLWSLSYEFGYYLLYPLFWRLSRLYGIWTAVMLSALVSGVSVVIDLSGTPNHLCNVMGSYWIWCFGALLGELRFRRKVLRLPSVPYYVVMMAAIALGGILDKLGCKFLPDWCTGAFFGAFMLAFQSTLVGQCANWRASIIGLFPVLLTMVVFGWLYGVLRVPGSLPFYWLRVGMIGVLIGAFMLFPKKLSVPRFCSLVLRPFLAFGMCSYAVYIFHWPILVLTTSTALKMRLDPPAVMMVLITFTPLIVLAAFFLEGRIQPRVASMMDRWFSHLGRES